jgi:hypothetical protein
MTSRTSLNPAERRSSVLPQHRASGRDRPLETAQNERPTHQKDAVICAACGTTLLLLTYAILARDDPRGRERATLKCPGCGQRYRWQGSRAWVPVDSP